MNLLISIFKISRPLNCLITFFAIISACIICGGIVYNLINMLLGGIVGLLVTASGNIINDYYDIDEDKINRPNRVLSSEKISPGTALMFYFLFSIVALLLSLFLGFSLFVIVAFTSLLLYLYSSKLKRIPLIGNTTVALLTGVAFVFGSIIVGNIYCGIIPALFAFMISLMRELIKEIEDIPGDSAANLSTYPIKYGVLNTINLITIIGIVLIIITTIPYLLKIYDIKYFIIIMPGVNGLLVFVISKLRSNPSAYNLKLSSNLLKLDMVLGIIAILFGSNF